MPDKDPKKVQLGQRIRELREGRGLTREQLAGAARVSVRAVVQWEIGVREPGWFNVLALCVALGVDCRAFAEAPSQAPEPRRGRPRKAPQEDKPRRPRKRKPEGE
jgi:transcriptional regulator with XRE-family HTH domain